ncbi:hsp90 co-chaperone Cdc37 [Chamberlinius hualienensis]
MVDYSKWKDIEISDDEDDTHPNIDTPSLFRWRHQARVERMEEQKREKEEFEKKKNNAKQRLCELQQKLKESETTGTLDVNTLKLELSEVEKQHAEFSKKEEELTKKERMVPWNVDTISRDGFSKTIISKPAALKPKENLTEEELAERQRVFAEKHKSDIKKFGLLRRFDDSRQFLQDHLDLVCEEATNYLVIWCIDMEVQEKHDLMGHVAHQCMCLQYILELGKQLQMDPKSCVSSFFTRIQMADAQYVSAFEDEIKSFKERVKERAKARIERAMAEAEEEERKQRLGPGGLDPMEVFESLPEILQKCFEMQNIPMLQDAIRSLPEQEARYHMKRCVDSGLWVPEGGSAIPGGDEKDNDN